MATAADLLNYYLQRVRDGQVEDPLGSNHCTIDGCPCEIGGQIGGMVHYAWCARQFNNARAAVGMHPVETASCYFNIQAYKNDADAGTWLGKPDISVIDPGDQVFYGKNGYDHTGVVAQVDQGSGRILTYEGNVSDRCRAQWRAYGDSWVYGVGRPLYDGVSAPPPAPVEPPPPNVPATDAPAFPLPTGSYFGPRSGGDESVSGYYSHRDDLRQWQQRMSDRGWSIGVDGLYGDETARVARLFQAEKGLDVDGEIGPDTWGAAWTAPVV